MKLQDNLIHVTMRYLPPLKSLQAFEAAARLGSFAAAADELFLTPSAISHHIRTLEERLGIALFHRIHRGVTLTDAGRRYAQVIGQGLGIMEIATRRIEHYSKSDVLTVHAVPSLASQWLMPRLSRFSAQYPDIDVRINASVNNINLTAEQADFDIRYGTAVSESGVIIHPFPKEPMAIVCAPALMQSEHPIHTPKDLQFHTLIHSEVNRITWRDWLNQHPDVELNLARGPRFDRSFMAISAAIDCLGVAMESRLLLERELEHGHLIMPLGPEPPKMVFHHLLYLESKAHLPKMIAFKEWLFTQLNESFTKIYKDDKKRKAASAQNAPVNARLNE